MDAWQTLKAAIPDGTAKAVALRYGVTADHLRRWRREPLSDEAPLASGQRSPLDRVCDLVDAVFLAHPPGTVLIVDHVRDHYHHLIKTHSLENTPWNRREDAAEALREAVEAVNCLNLDVPNPQTEKEILEARDAFDRALIRLRKGDPRK